ncbi:methylamine utilization protein [uncultured Croceicoccus sp.]|uniref:methylamine utilization protein n=1 Tax=uncultured Croceicoccus sp. TaxID=1295329 RepID=UPI002623100A|nr:methylamine utilization protein [uncultured Croceicoccus sp.]
MVEITPAGGVRPPTGFAWRAAMAQKDLTFTPGTLIVAKGAVVAFPNLDRVRHSIYSFSRIARFEIDLYGRDQTRTQKFDIAGGAALGCNIHDDMRGYVRVVETPFAAKTDGNGFVQISGIPAGNAAMTVWHPRLRAPASELRMNISMSGDFSRKIRVRLR